MKNYSSCFKVTLIRLYEKRIII